MSDQRAYGLSAALTARPRGFTSYGHILRIAIATTVSYLVALHVSGSPLPVFAPITTLSVVQASPFSTLGGTAQRVIGTAVGVAAAAAYLEVVPVTWWSVFLAILGALLIAKALPVGLPGQLQIPIAVIFVLVLGPADLSVDLWRVIDVVIGGLIGVVAVLLLPGRPQVAPAVEAVDALVSRTAAVLREAADELRRPRTELTTPDRHGFVTSSRSLRESVNRMRDTLDVAVESHQFNLRRPDHELALEELGAENSWVWRVVLQTRSLMGTLDGLYDRPGPEPLLVREDVARLLEMTASLLEVRHVDDGPGTSVAERDLAAGLAATVERVGARGAAGALQSLAVLGRIEQLRQLVVEGPVVVSQVDESSEDLDRVDDAGSWRERLRTALARRAG